jgi:hypothetical protein
VAGTSLGRTTPTRWIGRGVLCQMARPDEAVMLEPPTHLRIRDTTARGSECGSLDRSSIRFRIHPIGVDQCRFSVRSAARS